MTPDTSPADLFTWIGGAIGAAIASWAVRHGVKDKDKSPIATPEAAATASAGIFDAITQREIALDTKRTADGVEGILKTMRDYLRAVEEQRAKDKAEAIEDRVESVEDKLDRILTRIDDQERGAKADRSRRDHPTR